MGLYHVQFKIQLFLYKFTVRDLIWIFFFLQKDYSNFLSEIAGGLFLSTVINAIEL